MINCWEEPFNFEFGQINNDAGAKAVSSLEKAVSDLIDNKIEVLVTAPINKQNIQSEVFNFPGHTNYIAERLGEEALMFMVHEDIKVGLLTDHVPLDKVVSEINEALIQLKANKIKTSLVNDFNIEKPRVAVLSINPHVGDNGIIGSQDLDILIPSMAKINEKEPYLFGPFPADSFFGSGEYKNYDAILASYHDQGLIPFKTLSFGKGVNFTAGLSRVRTSPDHGTAYAIAGKNIANERSFKSAILSALSIFENRKDMNKKM